MAWLLILVLAAGAALPAAAQPAAGGMVELIVELTGQPLLLSDGAAGRRDELEERQDRLLEEIRALPGGARVELRGRYVEALNAVAVLAPEALSGEIAALPGVDRVHRAAVFQAPKGLSAACAPPQAGSGDSSGMVGLEDAFEQGLDGTGVVIAVIDTGLNLKHPAFSAGEMDEDAAALDLEGVEKVLGDLNAARMYRTVRAEQVWHSVKLPFAFNYTRGTTDVSHGKGGDGEHGTHVAAIAAGAAVGNGAAGAAPGAQILAMKVFDNGSDSATEVGLLSALEDAVMLGADIINLSLGTVSGFSDGEELPYTKAVQNAVRAGIMVCAAAGNEFSSAYGNVSGRNLGSAENVDIGVVNEPSCLDGVLSVASANNAMIYSSGFCVAGGDGKSRFVPIGDNGAQFGLRSFEGLLDLPGHRDGVYEYAVVPGLGTEEDFAKTDVRGRIALIQRGELTFVEKCDRAFENGAAGVVIHNNEAEAISMDLTGVCDGNDLPCVMISREDGERMVKAAGEAGVGRLTVLSGAVLAAAEDGWQPSSFSSWGPLSDLTLKPDAAGVGGSVYFAADDGSYDAKNGTSLAAPQASGVAALLLQYLRESQGLTGAAARARAQTLLLNTAIPMRGEDGVEYSPRKQGAGLLSAGRALSTPVWLTVDGSELPKAELGDDKEWNGVYEFSFTAHNPTASAQTYLLHASVLTETEEDGLMLQQARKAEAKTAFSGSGAYLSDDGRLTVPAESEAQVCVSVRLTSGERKALREDFQNGVYIEGYVYLDAVDDTAPDLSIPMLAFYGDWGLAPLFEDTAAAEVEAAKVMETDGNCPVPFRVLTGPDSYLGENPMAQDYEYRPERSNALNTGGKEGGVITNMVLDLLRNARNVTVEMVDGQGGTLYSTTAHNMVKSCLQENLGGMYPAVFSRYADLRFDPTEYGLKDGDSFTVRMTGVKDADGPNAQESMELPVYVDGAAPAIVSARVTQTEGRSTLTVRVRDNFYTAGLRVVAGDGQYAQKVWPVNQDRRGETVTLELDVTEFAGASRGCLTVEAMDYARNASSCDVEI